MKRRILVSLFVLTLIPSVGAQRQQEMERREMERKAIETQQRIAKAIRTGEKLDRLTYIKLYAQAMSNLARKGDSESVARIPKFGGMIGFLTEWDDATIEKRRQLLDSLVKEAMEIAKTAP
jgi:hypothetical protein